MSLSNTSYVFIPFSFEKRSDFGSIISDLDKSQTWELKHDEIKYMLKYVADKIDSKNRENCQCFHYVMKDEAREKVGLASAEEWYTTLSHENDSSVGETIKKMQFRFHILGVQLYCFSSSVCIMAMKLHFEENDPLHLSTAQYFMKKVSREKVKLGKEGEKTFTFLDLSKTLTAELDEKYKFDFFFYCNPSTERSNLLTYLEVEKKNNDKKSDKENDYTHELFYLRRCYGEDYSYIKNEKLEEEEIYSASADTVWGISREAAVCLTVPDGGRAKFIQGKFYENFNAQYLFMYVLLLHQKYVLYMFLTKIGIGTYNDLQTLEEYRHELYEFETDFVFSCITEVPQYQWLYDRMVQAFALKQMYEDVHEPLLSLGDVRRAEEEKQQKKAEEQQKKRDDRVNIALIFLSILSFFSALVDSFAFADLLGDWFLGDIGAQALQVVSAVGIVAVLIYVLISLIKSKKE